jgi:phage shock protein A
MGANAMTLINRFARLFRADLHALLDRVEEPDILLRQAVREMEESLDEDERRRRVLERECERLAAREAEAKESLSSAVEEMDLCFAAGKEELARALIRRKLENERAGKAAAAQRQTLETELADLSARVEENRERLDIVRQRAELLGERAPEHSWETAGDRRERAVSDEEVEIAYLREKRNREGQP